MAQLLFGRQVKLGKSGRTDWEGVGGAGICPCLHHPALAVLLTTTACSSHLLFGPACVACLRVPVSADCSFVQAAVADVGLANRRP